jgi:hypothetical protein
MKLLVLVFFVLFSCLYADSTKPSTAEQAQQDLQDKLRLNKKLKSIIIPEIEFKEASLESVIAFFVQRSRELDPEKRGINFVLSSKMSSIAQSSKITLSLRKIPLSEALRYSLMQIKAEYRIDSFAVVIFPLEKVGSQEVKE